MDFKSTSVVSTQSEANLPGQLSVSTYKAHARITDLLEDLKHLQKKSEPCSQRQGDALYFHPKHVSIQKNSK